MSVANHALILPADWRDFLALTKPRVMTLVVFTGLCGMLAAPVSINPVLGFTAILCIALGAGAAGALNQWYEADLDSKMKRTQGRPASCRPHGPPVGAAFRRRGGGALGHPDGACGQLCRRGHPVAVDPVLRPRLHRLAQAPHAAEHRHRRRGGRLPAADRLGCGDRRRRAPPGAAVRSRLPVDPAAFLGARAVREDRLRQCRRADASGGRRREGDARPDRALHHPDGGRRDRALAARPHRRALRHHRGGDDRIVRALCASGRDAHGR
ncbi:ubiA prenyltransferase family domain-containing protein [Ditylenchus destructor]|uniref:Protoheme IX farnesyltransferase n=1 Tax=Ditylenchus destructor TaxID=166010 RepID=A0AAD4ME62_9BILA|nr:ubiA prenyltransferase family domain-containing protein [Ditylenchus destructor]